MGFADYSVAYGGIYPLGNAQNQSIANLSGFSSNVLNTRDLGQAGAPDFVVLGPGSQVWDLGYSIRCQATSGPVTDPDKLVLGVFGSFDNVPVFIFGEVQRILLPLYGTAAFQPIYEYSGRVRVEWPAAQLSVTNNTGVGITASWQFWGKAW